MKECVVCLQLFDKLYKNSTCSQKCNAVLRNKNSLLNGTHNFLNQSTETCPICNKSFLNIYFQQHKKACSDKICMFCNKSFIAKDGRYSKFCSQTCSARFNNKNRLPMSDQTKQKIGLTLQKYSNIHKKEPKNIEKNCIICNNKFYVPYNRLRKTCSDECKAESFVNAGKKSSSIRRIRSVDEIALFDLCSSYFDKVEHNKIIIDGWDSDIIINNNNLIFWNGPWHYMDIKMKRVSLSQIQNRDYIKINKFIDNGYKVFIYEDRYYTPEQAFEDLKLHI